MIRKLMRDIDMHWLELKNQFPAFDKPIVIPARAITQEAPMYMRRYIDQDPDSYYIFLKGDVNKGDCSREAAVKFFYELMYKRLGIPSSYEDDEMLSPEMAASKELLPADNDRNYENFFEEQLRKMRDAMDAEAREQRMQDFEKKNGFRQDDPDIIDVDAIDPNEPKAAVPAADANAVGMAQNRAVALPKPVLYAIDIHVPAGGALGWNGPAGRLGGPRGGAGRGPRGLLRETETDADSVSRLLAAYRWSKFIGTPEVLTVGMAMLPSRWPVFIFRYADGAFQLFREELNRTFNKMTEAVSADVIQNWWNRHNAGVLTVMTKDELEAVSALNQVAECDGPEKMMKEFVEKKENGEVEEDDGKKAEDYDEGAGDEDEDEGAGDEDEGEGGEETEDESEELNESMIRFCDRLIRG